MTRTHGRTRAPLRVGAVLLGALAAVIVVESPAAHADRTSAAAAMPDGMNPFLLVTRAPWSSTEWDDATRRPEYAVYPDGQFLVTKADGRLWGGVLSREQTLDLMDFLATDVEMASLQMTYVVSSPVTTFTTYAFATRSGTTSVRRRASGGFGTNVKTVERALDRVDERLAGLADFANHPYAPGRLLVVSRPVSADATLPVWTLNTTLPFVALSEATDFATRRGALLAEDDARRARDALDQSPAWRFDGRGTEFRVRPALPNEGSMTVWRNPVAPAAPTPVPPIAALPPPVAPPLPAPAPLAPPAPAPLPAPAVAASMNDGAPMPAAPAGALPETLPAALPEALPAPALVPIPVAPAPVPAPAPAPAPIPAPAPTPQPGDDASGWRDDDLDYAGVQKIFVDMKRKTSGAPHVEFWKKDYDAFLKYEFALTTTEGKVKIVVPGDAANSNLIRALTAKPMRVLKPDGSFHEEQFSVMPPKGAPMNPADIERIRRWIDRGCPKERPASTGVGAGSPPPSDAPVPPTAPTPPTAPVEPAVASQVTLSVIGADTIVLGDRVAAEDGAAAPRFYVACDGAAWERIFTDALPRAGGPHGAVVAKKLEDLRLAVRGYDWGGSPLVLFVAPASDNYEWSFGKALDVLADGTGRFTVSHTHEARTYARAPDILVRWAVYRADTTGCPRRLVLKDGDKTLPATNAE